MKLKSIYFLLLFTLFSKSLSLAQELSPQVKREVDSLKRELRIAKHDTSKVIIRCLIGYKLKMKSVGFWDSLIKEAKRCNLPLIEMKSLIALGYTHFNKNENLEAEKYDLYALRIAKKIGDKKGTAKVLYYLSNIYIAVSNWEKALDVCFECLKLAEELDDIEIIRNTESQIGRIYFAIGQYDKSLERHLKILNGLKSNDNKFLLVESMLAVGSDYHALKNNKMMAFYYLKTKKHIISLGENATCVSAFVSIAAAYVINERLDSALKYSNLAVAMARKLEEKQTLISASVTLADILFRMQDYVMAKKTALESYKLLQTTDFKLQIPDLTQILRKIYEAEGNYKEALNYYEIGIVAKDSLQSNNNRKQVLEKEFNYNLGKKESENKLLAQQNQIQSLQLNQNRYLLVGVCALLLLVLLIGYLFLRQNKLKAQQQSSELEQKLLRSQMNPHFIFNSLQAIQNFIMKNEKKEAFMYLSSFADITRNVLENSRMEAIPLKKEISLLENYLLLQKLRFQERFVYAIHVDEAIDLENTTIAPMLSQPFIENAVEHGMYNIENDGRIDVYYTIKNDFLLMEIVDNGHGMGSSGSSGKQHQSLAMQITKERVALMNKKSKKKTEFKINDAYPEQIKRKGVKISFTIPLNLSV